jgi:hypothetical protein
MGLSVQRINYLVTCLRAEGWITYVDRETYKVNESVWEAPPVLP